jgi:signal transduction histidine kinase
MALFTLASIAHELKTPMVVMLGYTDLLNRGQLGPVTAQQRQALGEMQESAERLQRLISNTLRLCQLRHRRGQSNRNMEASEVNLQLKMIFDHWKPTAKRRSIEYQFLTGSKSGWVQMNPTDLHLVVSNLIENALKFTPERGTVMVTVKTCFWDRQEARRALPSDPPMASERKIGNAVQIDVRDTGPGIAPQHRQEVFKDFVQLQGAPRGNGLGLAIAWRIVMAHGGRIWVDSAPTGGSDFSVLLPTIEDSIYELAELRSA